MPPSPSSSVPSSLSVGVLSLLLFFWTCLTLQVRLIRSHHRSRPLAAVSLTDLVNADLVAAFYFSLVVFLCAEACSAGLAVALSHYPALAYSLAMEFISFVVALYLTVSVCVQYAHVTLESAVISEGLDDEMAIVAIRCVVVLVNASLVLALVPSGGHDFFYVFLTRDFDREPSRSGFIAFASLLSVALITNAVLRSHIIVKKWRLESKAASAAASSSPPKKWPVSCWTYAGVTCAFLASTGVVMASSYSEEGDGSDAERAKLVVMGCLCVVVPAGVIVSNRELRWHVIRRTCDSILEFVEGCRQRSTNNRSSSA